jgi:hypothetical protein
MATLSLLEAAKEVGKSKSSIWRAGGALSGTKNDAGQFVVDSSELFRVFEPKRSEPRGMTQDAAAHVTHEADDTAVRLAVYEAKLEALQAMVQELRQSRDHWQAQAERLALTAPIAVSPATSPASELPPFHYTATAGANPASAPSWTGQPQRATAALGRIAVPAPAPAAESPRDRGGDGWRADSHHLFVERL